jgi:sugar-specific transcriptional regulator TrmB/DNA-binding CsgD family transcriptional regulator
MDEIFHRVYRLARERSTDDVAGLARHAGISCPEAERVLRHLESLGLLTPEPASPTGYQVADPATALTRLFTAEAAQLTAFQQEVSGTRHAIRELVENLQALQSSHRDTVQVRVLDDVAQVNRFLDEMAGTVRNHECVMHPGSSPPPDVIDEMALRDAEVASSGVRIRALYARHTAEAEHVRDYLLDAAKSGIDIRLAPSLPMRLLILDDDLALVPIDPDDSSRGAVAVFGPSIVRSLQAVFDHIWAVALPLHSVVPCGEPRPVLLNPQHRAVTRMLAAGLKDEVIARQMGISSRSLSRLMAGLFEELRVSTRFQAGMKAAQLGLLAELTGEEAQATRSSP